jgi:hypothetical protein
MSGLILFARYINTSMALRYEYSYPNTSSPSSFGLNESLALRYEYSYPNTSSPSSFGLNEYVSFSEARTTIGVLAE